MINGDRLLEIDELCIGLPLGADRELAVSGASLALARDEIVCIVGESGSGKSMLAHAIIGLLPTAVRISAGAITFRGTKISNLPERELRTLRGTDLGMIFQEPMTALNPLMRVGSQIEEVVRFHRVLPRTGRRELALKAMRDVGLSDPEAMAKRFPHQLSGGQRQRVMIAIALALQPDVLLADEPTTALDVTTQAQILGLIKRIQRERRMGVLLITHDFGVVAEIADHIVVMQNGRVVEQGTAPSILSAPREEYTRGLIASVPRFNKGRAPLSTCAGAEDEVVLRAEDLSKTYSVPGLLGRGRDVLAVNNVSLELRRGETLAVVGESGSGKSSLGRLLMRLSEPDAGSVWLNGFDLLKLRGRDLRRVRRKVQMVFQDPNSSLNPRWSIGEQIARGPAAHGIAKSEALARAASLLRRVGLDERSAGRYPHEFSGGQRQRIAIARALALEPEVLIADEPVSALDVTVQEQILKLLEEIQHELKLAMVFITHDLRIASRIGHRIAVMQRGEIVEESASSDLFRSPQHPYTRELIGAVPGRTWAQDTHPVIRQVS